MLLGDTCELCYNNSYPFQGVGMKTCQLTLHNDTNPPSLPRRQWLLGSGLGIVALLLTGCGAAPARTSVRSGIRGTRRGSVPDVAAVRPLLLDARQREAAVARAILAINAPYRFGGNTLDAGFDCSGLVQYVFSGVSSDVLPRSTLQWAQASRPIDAGRLQRGDLVFFNTMDVAFSHMGIYIGGRQFVHAPSSGKVVSTESLDKDYYFSRFDGARTVFSS